MRAFLLLLPVLMFGQTKFNQIRIITSMDGTAPGQIEFDTSRADNKSVVLKAPATATAGYTLTLPIAAPATTGDCLTGTTGGVLSFSSCAVGGYWTLSGADIYRLTGNVGIGLTNPAYKLDVTGTVNATGAVTGGSFTAPTVTATTAFQGGLDGVTVIGSSSVRMSKAWTYDLSATGVVQLGTSSTVGYVWKATDTVGTGGWAADASQWTTSGSDIYYNTGNVGIGTASPTAKLQVGNTGGMTTNTGSAFSAYGTGTLGTSATNYSYPFEVLNGTSGNELRYQVSAYRRTAGSDWTGAGWRMQYAVDNSFTTSPASYVELGNSNIYLGTGTTDVLSMVGTNVGIGVSPAHKLDVLGTSAKIYAGGTTTDTILYIGNADMLLPGQGGILTFHASAATPYLSITSISQGVANRNIALAPLGGNVGIGLTNPAYKLDVSGTLNATGAATLGAGLAVTGNLSFTGTLNTAISTTELSYLDGVTSAIQTQLGARAMTSTTISTTSPLTGGGDLSTNRTFACATCATTDTTQTISGSKTFSGALTMGANLLANSASAFDIGDATNYFQTVYAENGDFTNGAVANQYLKARKLEVADIAGSSGFWDHRSQASFVSNSSYTIRDNGGSRWLAASRAVSGSPTNSTTVFTDWVPALRSTGSGDAVSDSTLPALGATGSRWSTAFVNLLDATASLSLYPSGSVFLGALGNDWNRLWVGGVEATSFVRPQTDNGGTSGTAVKRWSTTYTNNLKADGTINLGTSSTVGYVWKATDTVGTGGWALDASQWTTSGSDIYYNTGNVGIGVSPAHKLDVLGTSAKIYAGGTTTDTTLHIGNADVALPGQGGFLTFHASAATPYLSINALSQGVAYRNIALAPSGGNVGIGTTSPAEKLHIIGNTVSGASFTTANGYVTSPFLAVAAAASASLGQDNGVSIMREQSGASWPQIATFTLGRWTTTSAPSPQTRLDINLKNASDGTDIADATVMTLQSNGNVGIGTASPAYKLDVSGTLNATGAATLGAGLAVTGNLSFTGTLNTAISTTELGYLDGVTSAIQTQFSARALTSTQIFTTSPLTGGGDLSTNRTFACATCFTTAGGTMTGNLVVNTNLSVGGDYFPISDLGADLGSASFRFGGIFHAGGDNYGSHRTRNGANLTIMSGGAVYADAGSSVDFSGTVTTGGSSTYSGTTSCGSLQAVKTITVSRGLVTAVTCGTP